LNLDKQLQPFKSKLLERGGDRGQEGQETVVLLLDRTLDLHTPFIHDFTYISYLTDLLNIENDLTVSTGSGRTKGKHRLNEKDFIF
jgi:hypothetical protein